jgi:hypothetical protein
MWIKWDGIAQGELSMARQPKQPKARTVALDEAAASTPFDAILSVFGKPWVGISKRAAKGIASKGFDENQLEELLKTLDRQDVAIRYKWGVRPQARALEILAPTMPVEAVRTMLACLDRIGGGFIFWDNTSEYIAFNQLSDALGDNARAFYFDLEDSAKRGVSVRGSAFISQLERQSYSRAPTDLSLVDEVSENVAVSSFDTLGFENEPLTSEGNIRGRKATENFKDISEAVERFAILPPNPPRIWGEDFRGKSKEEKAASLIAFLEEVYGPFFEKNRDLMRDYLREKDPRLHLAIKNYGFSNLPEHLQMPSMRDRLRDRIRRAAAGEYDSMTDGERRSVRGGVARLGNTLKT